MSDLIISEYRDFIENLISMHIEARLEIVASKEEMDGKLGRAIWGGDKMTPIIQLPRQITAQEIDDSLLALAVRGHISENQELICHAEEIDSPLEYLKHLVLHEVAHIKNNWYQDREIDCDLWVYGQMHKGR